MTSSNVGSDWRQLKPTPCHPIYEAIIQNNAREVENILTKTVDPVALLTDQSNDLRWTPLHCAARINRAVIVALLLRFGAPLSLLSRKGDTPLHFAAFRNAVDAAAVLLKAGADPDVGMDVAIFTPFFCVTPMHMAARANAADVIKLLLEHGASVDPRDSRKENDGWTPLWYAAEMSCPHAMALLLDANADISSASEYEMDIVTVPKAFYRPHHHHDCVPSGPSNAPSNAPAAEGDPGHALESVHRAQRKLCTQLLLTTKKKPRVLDLRRCGLSSETAPPLPLKRWQTTPQIFETIDLTQNPGITRIPLWLHALAQLEVHIGAILLDAECLELPLERSIVSDADAARKILEYVSCLTSGEMKPVAMPEIKLMIMGRAAVGKTSLVRSLNRKEFQDDSVLLSTDGIDLGRVFFHYSPTESLCFTTWDFGGQNIYRFTHQLFLTSNSIYLLLWNITDPAHTSVRELSFWLNSIAARVAKPTILLVATHYDRYLPALGDGMEVTDWVVHVTTLVSKANPATSIHSSLVFSSAPGHEELLTTLQQSLVQIALQQLPKVPLFVAGALSIPDKLVKTLGLGPPVVSFKQFQTFLEEQSDLYRHHNRRDLAINCLDVLGSIFIMDPSFAADPDDPTTRLVILQPQWLAQLLATIVTTRHTFIKNGILHHRDLPQIWSDALRYPPSYHSALHAILQQLDVLYLIREKQDTDVPPSADAHAEAGVAAASPHDSLCLEGHLPKDSFYARRSLVPCLLPAEQPEDLDLIWPLHPPAHVLQLRRVYQLDNKRLRIPIGVMPRFLSRLFQLGHVLAAWQQGALVVLLDDDPLDRIMSLLVQVDPKTPWELSVALRIARSPQAAGDDQADGAPASTDGAEFEQKLHFLSLDSSMLSKISHLSQSIKEMVHGLLLEFYHVTYQTHVQCYHAHCREHLSTAQLSVASVAEVDNTTKFCPAGHPLRLELLAPDFLVITDRSSLIQKHRLTLVKKIGQGAYGAVWLANLDGATPVALKMLMAGAVAAEGQGSAVASMDAEILDAIKEFQHEVWLMKQLRHPCVVQLLGVTVIALESLSPAMVMELVPGGHLHAHLNDPFSFYTTITKYWRDLSFIVGQYDTNVAMAIAKNQPLPPPLGTVAELIPESHQKLVSMFQKWGDLGVSASEQIEQHFAGIESCCQQLLTVELRDRLLYKNLETEIVVIAEAARAASHQYTQFDWCLRIKLAADIAAGLAYLHNLEPPIVHRDLKTPNIFMMRTMREYVDLYRSNQLDLSQPLAKVGDFGLSAQLDATTSLRVIKGTGSAMDMITPTWAAPEVLQGRHYSVSSDIYALGIILWEILSRSHPFSGQVSSDAFIMGFVLSGGRPKIPEQRSSLLTVMYTSLINLCWDANPHNRPAAAFVYEGLRSVSLLLDTPDRPFSQHFPALLGDDPYLLEFNQSLATGNLNGDQRWGSLARSRGRDPIKSIMLPTTSSSLGFSKQTDSQLKRTGGGGGGVGGGYMAPIQRTAAELPDLQPTQSQGNKKTAKKIAAANKKKPVSVSSSSGALAPCHVIKNETQGLYRLQTLPLPDKVTAMYLSTANQLFLAFRTGHIGCFDMTAPVAKLYVCPPFEVHSDQVVSITSCFGHVWTCTKSGHLRVWPSQPLSVNDVVEMCSRKGWFMKKKIKLARSKIHRRWIVLENAHITWYQHRVVGHPKGSIHMSQIKSIAFKDNERLVITYTRGKTKNTMELQSAESPQETLIFHRLLQRLQCAFPPGQVAVKVTQSQSTLALPAPDEAGHLFWNVEHFLNVEFSWMTTVSGRIWTMSKDCFLCSWSIDASADKTGLRPDLRKISIGVRIRLDFIPLVPISLIGYDLACFVGPQQISTLQLTSLGISSSSTDEHASTKWLTALSDPQLKHIWTVSDDGKVYSWVYSEKTTIHPRSVLILPTDCDGAVGIIRVNNSIWISTRSGRFFSIDPAKVNPTIEEIKLKPENKPSHYLYAETTSELILSSEIFPQLTIISIPN